MNTAKIQGPMACLKKCGDINPYADGPYTCWSCRHGASVAPTTKAKSAVPSMPPAATPGSTGLSYSAVKSVPGGSILKVASIAGLPKESLAKVSVGMKVVMKDKPKRDGGGVLVAPTSVWNDGTGKPIYLNHNRLVLP